MSSCCGSCTDSATKPFVSQTPNLETDITVRIRANQCIQSARKGGPKTVIAQATGLTVTLPYQDIPGAAVRVGGLGFAVNVKGGCPSDSPCSCPSTTDEAADCAQIAGVTAGSPYVVPANLTVDFTFCPSLECDEPGTWIPSKAP